MDISYYEFTNLPDEMQFDIVLSRGKMINENTVSNSRYVLYELSSFSVEIIYSLSKNKISGKNIFLNRAAYSA
ncbi:MULTISPECIES: hypothetical protein [Chryseobacterium]|jgi:hypothetical protein|uniref:Uncharacterized protein n=2 Tax=Chryseobacterium aquaticum TaxID=452084 RepID=A0A0Q3HTA1_9FLAO|nr:MULTISPECIES: hypothetical protein [Chryseobacterium]KQK25903.1 hypothetical protein AR438_09950 [Chryseobacterium aquaticum]KUJ55590.1 hypothetical protein AR686_12315 [Chryseobacterium aquaticum subsp. greenlandense]NMR32992.1 hypothetical protein [Chryseobacterium aquaticum]NRQ45077.1 hypothetical protein [Chryseobacterium sp. C-204]